MKKTAFNLGFTLLAASALTIGGCAKPEPLTADNDFACRDRNGNIVDDDHCGDDGNGGMGMFVFMSSSGYHKKYGKYPKGYSPSKYKGATTQGFKSAHGVTSRGGFGSSGRGFSAGS